MAFSTSHLYEETQPERIVPRGFVQNLIAKLHWLWNPNAAEERYDFTADDPQPRILRQSFEVQLTLASGETEPRCFTRTIESQTLFAGAGWMIHADSNLSVGRRSFLKAAGSRGLMLDGVFYPHHRIDKITPGEVQVIQEGDEDQG